MTNALCVLEGGGGGCFMVLLFFIRAVFVVLALLCVTCARRRAISSACCGRFLPCCNCLMVVFVGLFSHAFVFCGAGVFGKLHPQTHDCFFLLWSSLPCCILYMILSSGRSVGLSVCVLLCIMHAGWSANVTTDGKWYYVNDIDKITTWDRPTMPTVSGGPKNLNKPSEQKVYNLTFGGGTVCRWILQTVDSGVPYRITILCQLFQ